MKKSIFLIFVFLFILVLTFNCYGEEKPIHVLDATVQSSSGHYLYSQAIWRVINKYSSDIVVGSLLQTGGSYDECKRVAISKEADLSSFLSIGSVQELYSGTGKFEKACPEARMINAPLIGLYPFVVRVGANIKTIEDLEGKKYNEGPPGSGEEMLTKTILGELGIEPKYSSSSVADGVVMMKNRQVVGYTKFTLPDSLEGSMMDIATAQEITWLGFTKEQTEKISQINPLFYWYEVKKGTVKGLPDVSGMFFAAIIVGFTTNELPQQVVYHMVKDIYEHTDEIIASYPQFGLGTGRTPKDQLNLFDGVEGIPPMHAGVIQYWHELGFEIPEKLIPPEYQE